MVNAYISEPIVYIIQSPHLSSDNISYHNHYVLCSKHLTSQYVLVILLLRLVYVKQPKRPQRQLGL